MFDRLPNMPACPIAHTNMDSHMVKFASLTSSSCARDTTVSWLIGTMPHAAAASSYASSNVDTTMVLYSIMSTTGQLHSPRQNLCSSARKHLFAASILRRRRLRGSHACLKEWTRRRKLVLRPVQRPGQNSAAGSKDRGHGHLRRRGILSASRQRYRHVRLCCLSARTIARCGITDYGRAFEEYDNVLEAVWHKAVEVVAGDRASAVDAGE